jgi:uncharacterized membrane protein
MKNIILSILLIFSLFIVLDLPVILFLNKKMYQDQFLRINKDLVISKMQAIICMILIYLILSLCMYYFIFYPKLNMSYLHIFGKGALFGFCIYSVYNLTNYATISEWGLKETVIDTTWGTILSGIIAILSTFILKSTNLSPINVNIET